MEMDHRSAKREKGNGMAAIAKPSGCLCNPKRGRNCEKDPLRNFYTHSANSRGSDDARVMERALRAMSPSREEARAAASFRIPCVCVLRTPSDYCWPGHHDDRISGSYVPASYILT
jgi:hypothetical protein